MSNVIDVNFNWKDDECCEIVCPYCKEEITVGIYKDSIEPCKCGKRFLLHQRTWVTEEQPKGNSLGTSTTLKVGE